MWAAHGCGIEIRLVSHSSFNLSRPNAQTKPPRFSPEATWVESGQTVLAYASSSASTDIEIKNILGSECLPWGRVCALATSESRRIA